MMMGRSSSPLKTLLNGDRQEKAVAKGGNVEDALGYDESNVEEEVTCRQKGNDGECKGKGKTVEAAKSWR